MRQIQSIRQAQAQELQSIEDAQKAQFLEFSNAWDNYMAEYENTAYTSLEKLKEKHMLEFQAFHEKVVKEAKSKMKPSKELLELRKKQQTLARQKQYEEADIVKRKADQLEEWEKNKNEALVQQIVEKQEKKLKKQQQQALAALLKRIQRDRNEQLKHRQMDSERLIQRNKNVKNDIVLKHSGEAKKTIEYIKRNLGNTSTIESKTSPRKTRPTQRP